MVERKEKGQEAMKVVALKRGCWSRRAKTVALIVFVLALSTMLSGCSNRNHSPVAAITATPASGEAPLEVTLDASQSYDPDGDEITYKWNFGDGQVAQGETVQHGFGTAGSYTVKLQVTDSKGKSVTATEAITVSQPPNEVTTQQAFDLQNGLEYDTGTGLKVSVSPAQANGKANLVVTENPSPQQCDGEYIELTSVYNISLAEGDASQDLRATSEGNVQSRDIRLTFELPPDVDPRAAVILDWTNEGWTLAENQQGIPGGNISSDGRHISVVCNHLSIRALGTCAWFYQHVLSPIDRLPDPASWLYQHVLSPIDKLPDPAPWLCQHVLSPIDKLPDLPPLDPKFEKGNPSINDEGKQVLECTLKSPTLLGGAGGVWYYPSISHARGLDEVYLSIHHIWYPYRTFNTKLLPPGGQWNLKFEFQSTGGECKLCLESRSLDILSVSAADWADRLGLLPEKASLLVGIVKDLLKRPRELSSFKIIVLFVTKKMQRVVYEALQGVAGPPVKYLINLVPVSIDIATYINSQCDGQPDPCFEVSVKGVGHLPVARAGPNQSVNVSALVTLDGSASYDPQRLPLTCYWTEVGEPAVTLSDQTAMNPTFTPTAPGMYTFQLVVNNGQMDSPPDDVDITVTNVNQADLTVSSVNLSTPVANSGDNMSVTFTVQNKGDPISVEFQSRVFLSTTRYGGQGGQKIPLGQFSMSLDGSNSKTQKVNVAIPQVSAGNWYIAVYTDCGDTIDETNENNNINSAGISIGVLGGPVAPNEPPSVTIISPQDGSTFTEGNAITLQGKATDPEDGVLTGDALLWYAEPIGKDEPPSALRTGESSSINYLSAGSYIIGLTANDSNGNSSSASIHITVNTVGPTPPPSGPRKGTIAFVSSRDARAEIYVMNADGSNVQRLTYTPGGWVSQAPTWSPDGREIAFISGGDWDGDGHIGLGLCIMDSGGKKVREIRVNTNIPIGYINNLAWSPDGTQFAFVAPDPTYTDFDVYMMNINGSDVRKLTTDGKSAGTPSWSPDSKSIAFSSTRDSSDLRDIYIMNADGSNQRHLSNSPHFSSEPAWSPDGTRLACQADYNDIWLINIDGSNQIKLTNDLPGDYNCHPTWSSDGTTIVFVSDRDGNQEIYIANVDGSGETRLTDENARDWDPVWSPAVPTASNSSLESEHKIAFVSDRDPQGGIYLMNPDGSNVQRLSYGGQDPAWSPDGSRIAFTTAGASTLGSIHVMNSDGSNVRKLVDEVHGIQGIAWSLSGAKIAFASSPSQLGSPEIYVMNADGINLHNITNYWALDAFPTWSPNGTRIAFESYRDGEDNIYVMDADGSNLRQLTNTGADNPAWSPDGNEIAFGNGSICVINADGSNLRQLTNTGMDNSPTWSPDGTRIAFVSWRDGNQEIYVMNADGSNQHNVTNNLAQDWDPSWSPALPTTSNSSLKSGGEELALPVAPDLSIGFVSLSTSVANSNDNILVTFTVQDNGGPISVAFRNRVFLSTTRYGGQGGQKIPLGEFPMSLDGSNSKTQTVDVAIPQVSAGNWYIAVYTDCGETIGETNKNNNTNSAQISIGAPSAPVAPNDPPSVTIISPQDSSTFTEGNVITLQGKATDPEDGVLTGNALLWYAVPMGKDEPLSAIRTGESSSINYLSAGSYIIGLTANNSNGNSSSASIHITVNSAEPTPPPPGQVRARSFLDHIGVLGWKST